MRGRKEKIASYYHHKATASRFPPTEELSHGISPSIILMHEVSSSHEVLVLFLISGISYMRGTFPPMQAGESKAAKKKGD